MKKIITIGVTTIFFFQLLPAQVIGVLPRLIPYRKGNVWGYADSSGKIMVAPQFDEAVLFDELGIVSINGKKGILDTAGLLLVKCGFDEINTIYDNGFVIYARKGKEYYQFLKETKTLVPYIFPVSQYNDPNEQIEEIIEETYYYPQDSNINISRSSPGNYDIAVKKVIPYRNGTSKLIRIDSVQIIAADVRSIPTTDTLFLVRRNKKWGIISFRKKMIVETVYDSIYSLAGALAFAVRQGSKTGIIMPAKSLASGIIYDEVRNNENTEGFLVKIDKRWGVLLEDLKTRIMIDAELYKLYFTNSYLKLIGITNTTGKFLGYVDFNGKKYWE